MPILFDKVMNIKPNNNGKLLLELIDKETLRLIVNSKYVKKAVVKVKL